MAVSRTLEVLLKERDARILYKQRVTSIGVENGRTHEVLTEAGGRFLAGSVVSNANAPDTLLEMLPESALPEVYANRARRMRDSISIATLYLGLNRESVNLPRHLLIGDDEDDLNGQPRLDVAHGHVLRGDFERIPLSVTTYSQFDPECAPNGCSVVAVSALAPWDYANVWGTGGNMNGYSKNPEYLAVKAEVERVLLERLEDVISGLSRSIEYSELSTPLTNVRYTGNRHGAVYGSEQSVHAMYGNRLEPATPIPNLFLAGAWAQFGGGQSAALMSGVEAGELAARAFA
jgi:prolycopene isomerase